MSTVYTVSKPCGHVVLRTLDKGAAVSYAREHSIILDAISCRTEEAEKATLNGPVDRECDCEEASQ